MKQKKGQVGVGFMVAAAMAVIVGLILFQASADNVEITTQSVTGVTAAANTTITTPALNARYELTGQELVGTPIVTNASQEAVIVSSGNYTIAECVRASDGMKGICYTTTAAGYAAKSVNVSYNYYKAGYIDDAGARSVTGIIVILAAIAIALVVLPKTRELFD